MCSQSIRNNYIAAHAPRPHRTMQRPECNYYGRKYRSSEEAHQSPEENSPVMEAPAFRVSRDTGSEVTLTIVIDD